MGTDSVCENGLLQDSSTDFSCSSDDYNENKLEDKKKKTQTIDERNLIEKFYCTDKGVIYEDDNIKVRFETRRVKYCVELKLVFLNKTKRSMSSLSCTLCLPDELEVSSDTYMEATVKAGGKAQAQFNI